MIFTLFFVSGIIALSSAILSISARVKFFLAVCIPPIAGTVYSVVALYLDSGHNGLRQFGWFAILYFLLYSVAGLIGALLGEELRASVFRLKH